MDLARLKTIKLFRKAHPVIPASNAVSAMSPLPPAALGTSNHTAAAGALSPITVPKRTQSQSTFSERTSETSINLEDRLTDSMNITDTSQSKPRPHQPAGYTSLPPKPGSAPASDAKAPGSSGLFRKFVGGKAK